MPRKLGQLQIGKNGITENFIETLKGYFTDMKLVKINVLKSARGEGKEGKEKVKEYAKEIQEKLGDKFKMFIIGFTITIKKYRKAVKPKQ